MGLKIDQVTVKFATAPRVKVAALSVSAVVSSSEAEEQRVQRRHELTANDLSFSKSKNNTVGFFNPFQLFEISPRLSISHTLFASFLTSHYLVRPALMSHFQCMVCLKVHFFWVVY